MNVKVPKPSDQAYVVATVADRLGCKVWVKLGSVPEIQMLRPWRLFKTRTCRVVVNGQLRTHRVRRLE